MCPSGPLCRHGSMFVVTGFVVVMLGIVAAPVTAQIPPDTVIEVAELEVIVGSRAGVADPATLPVPVDIYGAEEISRLGEVDLAEFSDGSLPPSTRHASRRVTARPSMWPPCGA